MIKYAEHYELTIERMWFTYQGEVFKGTGFLEWHPEKGVKIDALLNKNFAPVDSFRTVGQTIIQDKADTFTVWLKIRELGNAVVPDVFPLAQRRSFLPGNRFSIESKRILLFFRWSKEVARTSDCWCGSAIYSNSEKFEFPDTLKEQTTLGDTLISARNSLGLDYDGSDGLSVSGRHLTEESFELNWSLPKQRWTKNSAWCFGEAARKALSIIFAQTIWIKEINVTRGWLDVFDFRKQKNADSLGFNFRPLIDFGNPGLEHWNFNKTAFIKLAMFFLNGGVEADVSWRIFFQMADASRQKTWQGKEFFLSTILDAAFNTINNRPFVPGGRYGKTERVKDMADFKRRFLSVEWTDACKKALESQARLRHRNAHPDWLTTPGGALSKAELKASTLDLVYLSRFYGYMILAFAKFKNLQPSFPEVLFADDSAGHTSQ